MPLPTHELDLCECDHEAAGHSAVSPHACTIGVTNPGEYGPCKGGKCTAWRGTGRRISPEEVARRARGTRGEHEFGTKRMPPRPSEPRTS